MGRRPDDERPVGILYGFPDLWLAQRVLGDLREFGVDGVLIEHRHEDEEPEWDHVRGLVVVHTSNAHWSDDELATMRAMHADGRHVVFAYLSGKLMGGESAGVWQFPLLDRRYKVNPSTGAPGHEELAKMHGPTRPADGEHRRGYVFVSYSSRDLDFVEKTLVPTLVEQGFGTYDYRTTEEVNEDDLDTELRRWVDRCAVLLVVASDNWHRSADAAAELRHARALERGVVVLRRRSWPKWSDDQGSEVRVLFDRVADGDRVGAAIRRAARARAR